MPQHRYWLVLPNGGRQLIDPDHFDLDAMAERARRIGGRIVVEGAAALSPAMHLEAPGLRPASSSRRSRPSARSSEPA